MSSERVISTILQYFQTIVEKARSDAYYNQTTNYVAFMGYTILVWDHVITIADEVEYIWKRPKSPAAYLFFLNRYFTPIAFIGNLVAYFSEWSDETCNHFVRYEGSCTIIALEVAAIILLLRVWALYRDQQAVIKSCIVLLLIETGVFAWLMTRSVSVEHDYTVKACTMIFDPKLGGWPSLSAWMPLIFDTYVTVLILAKCMPRRKSPAYIFRVLMRDGLVYYSVIFLVNFILALMIVSAPPPIKNITAQLEQMITVAMISRITLSLRRSAAGHSDLDSSNAYHFDLDGWDTTSHEPTFAHTRRSTTYLHRVRVVPGSDLTLDSHISATGTFRTDADKAELSHAENANDSFGILSISPAHTYEAAVASGDIGIAISPEDQVAVIADPSMMNDRNAYELRVMRPAHCHTDHLRLPRG